MPAASTLAHGPGDRRIRYAGYDHLAADLAAHPLADAKSGRSVSAEQSEAFGVFHQREPTWRRPGTDFRVLGLLERLISVNISSHAIAAARCAHHPNLPPLGCRVLAVSSRSRGATDPSPGDGRDGRGCVSHAPSRKSPRGRRRSRRELRHKPLPTSPSPIAMELRHIWLAGQWNSGILSRLWHAY